MSLADEYRRQFAWRDWDRALAVLPPFAGKTVLDLGCAVGDLSAQLAARGARVIGVDLNEELLAVARARHIPGAEFLTGDLRGPLAIGRPVDGVWASFAAAYFLDLPQALGHWTADLRADGFVALTEIDDLFAHEPVADETRAAFSAYVDDALAKGRYDFRMGRRLEAGLERAGFEVTTKLDLDDREFARFGPLDPEVIEGWRRRLDRMSVLRECCGAAFPKIRDDFLACLARADHRSNARVVCCVARRREGAVRPPAAAGAARP